VLPEPSLFLLTSQIQMPQAGALNIHFLDVGYGDAAVIQTPEGKTLLVDGGKPEDGEKIAAFLQKQGIHKPDALIITHFHKDHAGGLLPLLRHFMAEPPGKASPPRIFVPFFPKTAPQKNKALQTVLEILRRRPLKILKRGDRLTFSPTVQIDILNPEGLSGDQNNDSLVLRLSHKKNTILLAADIGLAAQKTLLKAYGESLKSDLLKIPHHAIELERGFLDAVSPKTAVLTIGSNPYGAPDFRIVARYRKKARLLRSDRHGTVTVTSNGQGLKIKTER